MKATLLIQERMIFEDGAVLVIKIWRVPEAVPPTRHGLKYSLFYGRAGDRLVGYDNERGKGDHRHYGEREERYRFTSIERMLADFREDIEKLRGEKL